MSCHNMPKKRILGFCRSPRISVIAVRASTITAAPTFGGFRGRSPTRRRGSEQRSASEGETFPFQKFEQAY